MFNLKNKSKFIKKTSEFSRLELLLFVIVFALIGGILLWRTFAAGESLTTVQAEQMSLKAAASIISDASAGDGQAVKMTQTGAYASGTFSLSSAASSVNVIAKADKCRTKGWPIMTLLVDGSKYMRATVSSATWNTYSATTSIGSGSHSIKISFASASAKCSPILYVDSATFYGAVSVSPPPTVSIGVSPSTVTSGQTTSLTWSSQNADSCAASGAWSGTVATSGTQTTAGLTSSSTFTITCTGSGGAASASATVNVTAVTPPPTGLWKPTADKPITLHWVLGDALDVNDPTQMGLRDFNGNTLPSPDVYDIDGEFNAASTVSYLHSQGKKVICYIDAGVYETYRTDAYKFQALSPQIWGNADSGWNGSYWLDIRRVDDLAPIMRARMQMCKDKGFDAIEPDEITGWSNNSGFPLTYQDQIVYNQAVAAWAHNIGMSIGLKGDLEQAHDLVNNFDWTLNEQCYQYNECTTVTNSGGPGADGKDYPGLQLFVQQNKAVWVAEYKNYTSTQWSTICTDSLKNHFNTSEYKLGLPNNGGRQPCLTATASW